MRVKADFIETISVNQHPVFRKTIVPWYDSEIACFILIVIMSVVFWFGMIGITTAEVNARYQDHVGVPVSLVIMSAGVIVSITTRLVLRYTARLSK